jgi:hypothetical protein
MQPPCIGHIYFPSWKKLFSQLEKIDFPRHKKSLRLEAIGDNGHPAGLITIFL